MDIKFQEFVNIYINDLMKTKSQKTARGHIGIIKRYFLPVLNDKYLPKIKDKDANKVANNIIKDESMNILYRQRALLLLKRLFTYMVKNKYIKTSPLTMDIDVFRKEHKSALKKYYVRDIPTYFNEERLIEFINEDEMNIVMPYLISSEYKNIYLLILSTGISLDEIIAINTINDIYYQNMLIIKKRFDTKTGDIIDINPRVIKLNEDDIKLINDIGDIKYEDIINDIKRIKEETNISTLSIYSLRHYYIVHTLLNNTNSLIEASKYLGVNI